VVPKASEIHNSDIRVGVVTHAQVRFVGRLQKVHKTEWKSYKTLANHLLVELVVHVKIAVQNFITEASVLIDTGSRVERLFRHGLIPDHLLS